jgi:polyisoprenoid-binding protein YceI
MNNFRLLTLLSLLSFQSLAGWQLNDDNSRVNFMSTKQEHITESHYFKSMNGQITDKGAFTLNIDLSSVETNIGIRNERMQKWLFETASFAQASISADVSDVLKVAKKDSVTQATVSAVLDLHGLKKEVSVEVLVSNVDNDHLVVSTLTPLLINAGEYKFVQGIAKLQELAGLTSIGLTVPVTFNLVFDQ